MEPVEPPVGKGPVIRTIRSEDDLYLRLSDVESWLTFTAEDNEPPSAGVSETDRLLALQT